MRFVMSIESIFVVFLLVFLVRGLLRGVRILAEANFRRAITERCTVQIFEQQIVRHSRIGISRDSAEMIRDLDSVPQFLNGFIFSRFILFEEAVLIVGILSVLASQSTGGALGVLAGGGMLMALTVRLSSKALERAGNDGVRNRAKRLQFSLFAFRSIREILLYGKQHSAARTFGRYLRKVLDAERRFEIISRNTPIIIETVVVVAAVVVLWLTAVLLGDGNSALSIGVVLALGAFRIIPGISRFTHALQDMKFQRFQAEILMAYLQEKRSDGSQEISKSLALPQMDSSHLVNRRKIGIRPTALEVCDVSFSYSSDGGPIFANFSHTFSAGKLHVIKGESGRGKSTLLALLMGLAKPQHGQILLGGVPLNESFEMQNHQIAFVPQSVAALDYSLAENIALTFDEDCPMNVDRISVAVLSAGLGEFVNSLSEGLNTAIGELGSRVSGGQLQRIGLARALYREPKVLLLDETTSNLDFETEARILSDLARLKGEILIIMVSHSDHVAQFADEILEI